MKLFSNIILGLFILMCVAILHSCEKVDDPFEGITTGGDTTAIANADSIWGDTGNITIKKMMIEEVTGQQCGFCPPKTKLIVDWIDGDYKNKVYSVAYHATAFAIPNPKYPDDHRTQKGTDFNTVLGNNSAPIALFNRIDINGNGVIVQGSKFTSEFNKLVNSGGLDNPEIQLKTLNLYDNDSLSNRLIITGKAISDLNDPHTVIIYIVEDPVVGDQKDYSLTPSDLHNFDHRHMFRDAIGALDGNAFIIKSLANGESITKTYNYKLKDSWNAANCRFIIAIRNNSTGEIIQVDEVHAVKE